jgi:ParB family transcriptional regulator, chromosome partitioning protein
MWLETIPVASIFPGPERRLRQVTREKVQALADSIREIGLRTPISLREVSCEGVPMPHSYHGSTYHLVAGEHRLEACKDLHWAEIPAFIIEGDEDEATCRLWEIDENLVRADLTVTERDEHLKERKFWYERAHPGTKHGGAPGNKETGGRGGKAPRSKEPESGSLPAFVSDTAEKTGLSKTVIKDAIHRAEAIAPEVKEAIRDMPEIADKVGELNALAAVEPEEQKAAVEAVKLGKARNVREATKGAKKRKKRKPKPPPTDDEIVRRVIVAALKRCAGKIGRRIAAVQINCDGDVIKVAVNFLDGGAAA